MFDTFNKRKTRMHYIFSILIFCLSNNIVIGYSVNSNDKENSDFNDYTRYNVARDLLKELKSPVTGVSERSSPVTGLSSSAARKACYQGRCATGWTNFGNTCYYFDHEQVTFAEANRKCQQMHGQLVEVESEAEWVFLKTQAEKKSLDNFWIALTDAFEENDWSWINTWRTASFSIWSPGQPDNYNSDEHCAHAIESRQYQWNDWNWNKQAAFVCEA
ncbi:perlucin-like protein [Mercenaria mercenaria]|uniref:perlucin-like protein n=1 Tax=Mercenaria mercenaria TaxID=6596 RepID=UPI00234F3814|nr:perlucin-like protein [Mercenaria mercenaria]